MRNRFLLGCWTLLLFIPLRCLAATASGIDTPDGVIRLPLAIEGREIATLHLNGLGIGSASPQTALDVNGEIRLGSSAKACAPALEGALTYRSGKVFFCDGNEWKALGKGKTCDFSSSGLCAATGGCDTYLRGHHYPPPPDIWEDGAVYIWHEKDSEDNFAGAQCLDGNLHVFGTGV